MHIAVLFDRLGPYHRARLHALGQRLSVTAVEVAGQSAEYDWDAVDATPSFDRITLYPNADSGAVSTTALVGALHATLDEVCPDSVAIPGWSEPSALGALQWCLSTKTPSIVMSASSAIDATRVGWREWIKKRVVGQFDAGLVGGSLHRDYLVHLGVPRDRIFLGYDVVDNNHFYEGAEYARREAIALRDRYGLPRRYFLDVCRFIPKKNIPRLLEAYAAYRDRAGSKAWDLVLVGDGPERDSVEERLTKYGLTDVVHLPGFVQYETLPIYYGLADAFVHASTREQWGLVVNEAMASGLPVLVSDHCGCASDLVYPNENGLVFDPKKPSDIAISLFDVAHGSASLSLMGDASRRIIEAWSPNRFAESLAAAAQAAQSEISPVSIWDRILLKALIYR